MYHCLNKRIRSYETSFNEPQTVTPKLQSGNPRTNQKSKNNPDARRRPIVTVRREGKKTYIGFKK